MTEVHSCSLAPHVLPAPPTNDCCWVLPDLGAVPIDRPDTASQTSSRQFSRRLAGYQSVRASKGCKERALKT